MSLKFTMQRTSHSNNCAQLAFEIMAFGIAWWNVLDRPRTLESDLAKAVYRDGLAYFSVSICLAGFLDSSLTICFSYYSVCAN